MKSQSLNRVAVAAVRHRASARRADFLAVFRRIASRSVPTAAGHSGFDIRASLGFGYFVIRHSIRLWPFAAAPCYLSGIPPVDFQDAFRYHLAPEAEALTINH
ncbi:MAG: hypothetical protein FJ279_23870 [Planctomycetes bacterium]|nr:hypothetical protein [Planctomycetota bacterium]